MLWYLSDKISGFISGCELQKLGEGTHRNTAIDWAPKKSLNHFVCVYKSKGRPNFGSVFSAELKKHTTELVFLLVAFLKWVKYGKLMSSC